MVFLGQQTVPDPPLWYLSPTLPQSSLYTPLELAHPLTPLVNQDNFMIPSADPWARASPPKPAPKVGQHKGTWEWTNTESTWNRHGLDGDVGSCLAASLPLIAQHTKSRPEVSFAQGYPDIFNRVLNQTSVSCKILIAKLCLHKQIYFSWFHSTVNNKPPSTTPESLLCASVKLFTIIQLSDYVCPFVYLTTSETQKVLKHLQTR